MHNGGDRLWNRSFSQLSDLRDLDLGSGHTTYHCLSLIDLYLHTKFRSNQLSVNWRTYVPTYRRTANWHWDRLYQEESDLKIYRSCIACHVCRESDATSTGEVRHLLIAKRCVVSSVGEIGTQSIGWRANRSIQSTANYRSWKYSELRSAPPHPIPHLIRVTA